MNKIEFGQPVLWKGRRAVFDKYTERENEAIILVENDTEVVRFVSLSDIEPFEDVHSDIIQGLRECFGGRLG